MDSTLAFAKHPGRFFAVLAAIIIHSLCASAQDRIPPGDVQFFRIGTGPTTGIYFPAGALVASVVSNPPGSRPCERGGSCGVPGIIAVAQATQDSTERLGSISSHRIESGLVQSEVAYLAYTGKGVFSRSRLANLRAIGRLYPEYLHMVTRRESAVRSFTALKGKRIGLDMEGSGTRIMMQAILPLAGVKLTEVSSYAMSVSAAVDQLRDRRLDAFGFVSGLPVESIQRLADDVQISLLPLPLATVQRMAKSEVGLFSADIPAEMYRGVPTTATVATNALWVVSAEADEKLVYALTKALWHPNNRRLLDAGPPVGRLMRVESALEGVTIPLHSGAEHYYREAGYEIPKAIVAPASRPSGTTAAPGR
jgi:uncharacterized protein